MNRFILPREKREDIHFPASFDTPRPEIKAKTTLPKGLKYKNLRPPDASGGAEASRAAGLFCKESIDERDRDGYYQADPDDEEEHFVRGL